MTPFKVSFFPPIKPCKVIDNVIFTYHYFHQRSVLNLYLSSLVIDKLTNNVQDQVIYQKKKKSTRRGSIMHSVLLNETRLELTGSCNFGKNALESKDFRISGIKKKKICITSLVPIERMKVKSG